MTEWRLVSDVGGSNVRFARSPSGHAIDEKCSFTLKDYASFYDALDFYLRETGGTEGCTGAAIAAAGPVDGDRVQLTNADWSIEAREVQARLGGAPVRLVGDLQAVALALPYLSDDELHPLGAAPRPTGQRRTMVAVNVGTGFGGATVIPAGRGWVTNPGEPGHMALGAVDARQLELIRDGDTVEELLSGRGVQRLYAALGGTGGTQLCGKEIFARSQTDPIASETLRCFSDLLARVAGDLALASAAWGGVYLCGSVVTGWAEAGGGASFRAPFENKGAMSERMRNVYSGVITRHDIALVGLTYLPVGGDA